jgi:heme A synthase
MSDGRHIPRRLAAGVLLAAIIASAGGLHVHESFAGLVSPTSTGAPERVVSNHSPLSKATHWHSVVRFDEHPCLACHSHRMAGLAVNASVSLPVLIAAFAGDEVASKPVSIASFANGSRAPPSLL